jgi:hypothetical protein
MNSFFQKQWLRGWWLLILFMAIKLAVHLSTSTIYELQRDAYMYIDLGKHLAWGFHSVPPSIAVFANVARFLFGDNTFAIRIFPAVIGVLSLMLIGIMVREAGGGKWAQFFALLAFLLSPAFLRSNSLFQPVSFNQFYWLLLAFLLFRLIHTGKRKYWLFMGVVGGLAFLNKYSVVFCLAGIILAVLGTPLRKWLRTPWPFIAAGIAFLIALPNLIWQLNHEWPVIRHMEELTSTQLINVRLDVFLFEQLLMFIPVALIWIFGLIFTAFLKEGRNYRAFALIYAAVVILLMLLRGKPYYTIGVYSTLFVFGGLFIEKYIRAKLVWFKYVLILLALSGTWFTLPLSLPVLRPEAFIRFYEGTPMENMHRWEDGEYYPLPQDYADMIGWRELTSIVAGTYQSLEPREREQCVIFANNYGEAGSVNFYGTAYDLPAVISYNDSYIYWAPDSIQADYLIKIGQSHNLEKLFHSVEIVGRISTPYARQQGTPVYLCKVPKIDLNKFYQEELQKRRH